MSLKVRSRKYIAAATPGLAAGLVKFICRTLRIEAIDSNHFWDVKTGKVLAFWHGRTIPPSAYFRGTRMHAMISLSRDGEIQSRIIESLGFLTVRGSSGSNGARALVESIRLLKSGEILAITPDGPRGPHQVAQPGMFAMARKSGLPICPIGVSSRPCVQIDSWDHYMVPLPFSKCVIVFGQPVYIPTDTTDEQLEIIRQEVQEEMIRLQSEADRRVGLKNKERTAPV